MMFEKINEETVKTFEKINRPIFKKLLTQKSEELHKSLFAGLEGIEGIEIPEVDYQMIEDTVNRAFDLNNISGNNFTLPGVTENILPFVKGLAYSDKEAVGIFLLDNNFIKGYHQLPFGEETQGEGDVTDVIKVVIQSGYKDFAIVHNHPNHIGAFFSTGDDSFHKRLGWFSKAFDLNFIDSFVITPFDCCSSLQSNKGNSELIVRDYEVNHDKMIIKKDKPSQLLSSIIVKGLTRG